MDKKLIIFLILFFIVGCSNITTKNEENVVKYINYDEFLKVIEKNNNLNNELNNRIIEINSLKSENENLKNDIIRTENYWRGNMIMIKKYSDVYPTHCEFPKNIRIISLASTNSMRPLFDATNKYFKVTIAECNNYNIGDLVYIPIKDKQVKKNCFDLTNDMFYCEKTLHQIIEKNTFTEDVITKGINNDVVDNWKTKLSEIEGKVIKIEY